MHPTKMVRSKISKTDERSDRQIDDRTFLRTWTKFPFSRYACNMDGVYMLSMMDHITRRLDKLDLKNDEIKTEKKEPKLRFDKKVQKCQGDFVICGDIYQRKRARSCHILSHRVTNRPLTLGKAYEVGNESYL